MMVEERGEEAVRYMGGHPPALARLFLCTGCWQSEGMLTSPGSDWESEELGRGGRREEGGGRREGGRREERK